MQKISILTAYDFNTARALACTEIDYILVGDSLAMVALGHESTQDLSPEEMLIFLRAVRKGAPEKQIIADYTYLSYQKPIKEALADARALYENGADYVKIEGTESKALDIIQTLVFEGKKVFGHIGYTPQSFDKFTDSKVIRDKELLLEMAIKLDKLKVSGIVLEMIPDEIASNITGTIQAMTIGIGAGASTDGQVLVSDDLLGRFNLFKPKFVRRFASQFDESVAAFSKYIEEVKSVKFPAELETIK
jgi:3-methyl-2-oxobutanoate hydroxymethyltransferase